MGNAPSSSRVNEEAMVVVSQENVSITGRVGFVEIEEQFIVRQVFLEGHPLFLSPIQQLAATKHQRISWTRISRIIHEPWRDSDMEKSCDSDWAEPYLPVWLAPRPQTISCKEVTIQSHAVICLL